MGKGTGYIATEQPKSFSKVLSSNMCGTLRSSISSKHPREVLEQAKLFKDHKVTVSHLHSSANLSHEAPSTPTLSILLHGEFANLVVLSEEIDREKLDE